jgi:hypothetical protein
MVAEINTVEKLVYMEDADSINGLKIITGLMVLGFCA